MTYTVEQVVELLEESDLGNNHWEGAWQAGIAELEWEYRYPDHKIEVPGLGPVAFVDGYTGAEGGGEDVWMVFKVGDQYFRTTGYYLSYDGTTWDGATEEVEPFEKTVIDYRRVR